MAQTQDANSGTTDADTAETTSLSDVSTVSRDENGILRSACCEASVVMVAAGNADRLVQECEDCGKRL